MRDCQQISCLNFILLGLLSGLASLVGQQVSSPTAALAMTEPSAHAAAPVGVQMVPAKQFKEMYDAGNTYIVDTRPLALFVVRGGGRGPTPFPEGSRVAYPSLRSLVTRSNPSLE